MSFGGRPAGFPAAAIVTKIEKAASTVVPATPCQPTYNVNQPAPARITRVDGRRDPGAVNGCKSDLGFTFKLDVAPTYVHGRSVRSAFAKDL